LPRQQRERFVAPPLPAIPKTGAPILKNVYLGFENDLTHNVLDDDKLLLPGECALKCTDPKVGDRYFDVIQNHATCRAGRYSYTGTSMVSTLPSWVPSNGYMLAPPKLDGSVKGTVRVIANVVTNKSNLINNAASGFLIRQWPVAVAVTTAPTSQF
jgi:hypothetical protein